MLHFSYIDYLGYLKRWFFSSSDEILKVSNYYLKGIVSYVLKFSKFYKKKFKGKKIMMNYL